MVLLKLHSGEPDARTETIGLRTVRICLEIGLEIELKIGLKIGLEIRLQIGPRIALEIARQHECSGDLKIDSRKEDALHGVLPTASKVSLEE